MTGLTAQIADFIAGPAPVLDAGVLQTVRTGFIDTVAVLRAGAQEPVVQALRRWIEATAPQGGTSSVLLGPQRLPSREAARLNATAGHALDYDDVGLMGHPSVVLVPALLAEGERLRASGLRLMQCYVTGYEVWAELIARDQDRHHAKGWHPTAVFGIVAVAAAIAALRGLDAATARHALGLAATMAAGLTANFGAMAKPFHAGQAAAGGIDAVDLAQAGMTAAPDVLEHHAGFLAAISPAGRVDRSPCTVPLAQQRRIATLGLSVKKYPMCFATHRVIDGVLDLARAHAIAPADVEAVHATIGRTQAGMLRNHQPVTALEGKFSLEFAVAAALVHRQVGLQQLQDAVVNAPDVQALMPRVRIAITDTVCPHEPTLALSDRVVIAMRDGRLLDSGEIAETRGGLLQPLLPGELQAKFMDCTAGQPDRDALWERLCRLETLPDISLLPTP